MSELPEEDRRLSRRLERALGELPARRAPATLEARVLQELQRRSALPWWRRSFARWPRPVQVAFGSVCAFLIVATGLGAAWALTGLGGFRVSSALSMPGVQQILTLVRVARELATSVERLVPPTWIYGGLAASAALYAALFGLAVLTYHMLYIKSEPAGDPRP